MKRDRIRGHASGACLFQASAAGAALILTGCASLAGPGPAPAADSPAMRLAGLLESAARTGDPRLERAAGEMAALETALTAPVTAAVVDPEPQPDPVTDALPPAPDASRMASVFHAAHIASYRSLELAASGWQIYRQKPALSGLEAVAAEVELESGRWYRLKAGPFDTRGAAAAVCAGLEARGDWCAVTDFNGIRLPG